MLSQPSNFPTTSDISALMKSFGFNWSNQAQVYFDQEYNHITSKCANSIYIMIIGKVPFEDSLFFNPKER